KAGQADKAVKEFEESLKYDKESSAAWSRIGNLLMEKDPERARAAFEQALKLLESKGGSDARAHYALGKLDRAAGKNQEALEHFQKAISLFPMYAEAHREAADVAKALGNEKEADEHAKLAAAGGRLPPLIDPLYGQLLDAGMDFSIMIQNALMH